MLPGSVGMRWGGGGGGGGRGSLPLEMGCYQVV